ncbi:unnamed protein product [Lepeophtheirus salmonis]|uniref:(salmon louse) hypothetical protein n=1 Tax=Lepeophtheirus salmonis TaxID=72036 RepID=A0A7R8D0V1_LEPSM|nr:unnamed protein product [Lepeophtheirus salmonis]CAF2987644.1 unnamed protein product [Lepeophtheirus salmonis]
MEDVACLESSTPNYDQSYQLGLVMLQLIAKQTVNANASHSASTTNTASSKEIAGARSTELNGVMLRMMATVRAPILNVLHGIEEKYYSNHACITLPAYSPECLGFVIYNEGNSGIQNSAPPIAVAGSRGTI